MKNHSVLLAPSRTGLIAVILAAGFTGQVLAQSPPTHPTAPVDKTDEARQRQLDMNQREMQLRGLGNAPVTNTDPKRVQALKDQVVQDFKRILVLHNEIARAISNDKMLDYNFVSEATAEIKKRASRLQTTLAFQPPQGSKHSQAGPEELSGDRQLKDSLTTLCKQIKSFVNNPIIETPGTVDAQQLVRARSDLEQIIELSGNIKKSAERFKQNPR